MAISVPDRDIANLTVAGDSTSQGTTLPFQVFSSGYKTLSPAVAYTPAPAATEILVKEFPAAHLSAGMVLFWIAGTMKVLVTPAGIYRWATTWDATPDETVAFSPAFKPQEGKTYRVKLAAADANTFTVTIWDNEAGGTPSVATMTETALFTGNPAILFGRPTDAIMAAIGSAYKLATGVTFVSAATALGAPTGIALSPATIAAAKTAAGEIVGTLSSTHASLKTGFGYELVSGTGDTNNASFMITSGPYIRCAAAVTAGSKSIRVQTKDLYGQTYAQAITITVS